MKTKTAIYTMQDYHAQLRAIQNLQVENKQLATEAARLRQLVKGIDRLAEEVSSETTSIPAALLARVAELEEALNGAYGALKIALKCNHFTADEYAHIGEWTDEVRAILEKDVK